MAGNAAKAKEAVSQVRHPTQGGTRVKAQASSRTLKLPPARTYTEMAERQIKAAGHKVRACTSPGWLHV